MMLLFVAAVVVGVFTSRIAANVACMQYAKMLYVWQQQHEHSYKLNILPMFACMQACEHKHFFISSRALLFFAFVVCVVAVAVVHIYSFFVDIIVYACEIFMQMNYNYDKRHQLSGSCN